MRPIHLRVGHYRALRDFSLDLTPNTVLVGVNGVGKSTVLHALRFFFSPAEAVESIDQHGGCDDEISVTVTCADLSATEQETFAKFIVGDFLTLTKRCMPGAVARYYARQKSNPEFSDIRTEANFKSRRGAYIELRATQPDYADLPPVPNSIAALEEALSEWEQRHPEKLLDGDVPVAAISAKDENVSESTVLRFVEAMQDPLASVNDSRSPLRALIKREIIEVKEGSPNLSELHASATERMRQIFSDAETPEFQTLEARVNARLAEYAPGVSASFGWDHTALSVTLRGPAVGVSVKEDGYAGPLESKGHGVQRGVIFGTLRLELEELERENGHAPHLLMLVEEPEVFQHPTRARHFARLLRRLGETGSATVVLATHSPYFVRFRDFADVRLLRKGIPAEGIPARTVRRATREAVGTRVRVAGYNRTDEQVVSGIAGVLDDAAREGFFSRRVVLCEGYEDVAIISALSTMHSFDLDAADVSLIAVNGKGEISKAYAVFSELGIPAYVVFDADLSTARENQYLLSLIGATSTPPTRRRIEDGFTMWALNVGADIRAELASYDQRLGETSRRMGYSKAQEKNRDVVFETLKAIQDEAALPTFLADFALKVKQFSDP